MAIAAMDNKYRQMNSPLTPEITSELDPLIITSPAIRSGTTLLQRLLCSSSNALIYGEECGKDLEMFLTVFASKVTVYSHAKLRMASDLARVLNGEVNDWILDLMPAMEGYLDAIGRGGFAGLAYCRDYAAQVGRPIWGIKYPGWSPYFIRLLRQVMPNSRFIVIHRDIEGCLRSAKARRSVNSEEEARQFCRTWAENLAFLLSMKSDPSVLLLNYAELIAEPEKVVEAIAKFAAVRDMRSEILSYKINTRVEGDGQTTGQSGYIEPAALTEAEMRIAAEAASVLRQAMRGIDGI